MIKDGQNSYTVSEFRENLPRNRRQNNKVIREPMVEAKKKIVQYIKKSEESEQIENEIRFLTNRNVKNK